ncbi:hypothetical protein BDV96DRAFT_597680 [Lophiotrema nucula]|uniref:Uncharacterized protein n=1 Tax=Lophiotrema nucula TaxID=690887 RepID=A0A6A5ZF21_9PLEO|nr:hypothetical protein BDV96DRAFT_597680 [Lophiotrema nucula]
MTMDHTSDADLVQGILQLPSELRLEIYHWIWQGSVISFKQCEVTILAKYGKLDDDTEYDNLALGKAFVNNMFRRECVQHLYDFAQFLVGPNLPSQYPQSLPIPIPLKLECARRWKFDGIFTMVGYAPDTRRQKSGLRPVQPMKQSSRNFRGHLAGLETSMSALRLKYQEGSTEEMFQAKCIEVATGLVAEQEAYEVDEQMHKFERVDGIPDQTISTLEIVSPQYARKRSL